MLFLFGAVTLLLAAAVVVLFAMLGELYSRVEPGVGRDRESSVRLLTDVPVGRGPLVWPDALAPVRDAGLGAVLVLSTACASCARVAGQLRADGALGAATVGLVISTVDAAHGAAFVEEHDLGGFAPYVDERGAWTAGEFGVRTSPSALVFRGGALVSATVFTDLAALRAAVFDTGAAGTGTAETKEETWQKISDHR